MKAGKIYMVVLLVLLSVLSVSGWCMRDNNYRNPSGNQQDIEQLKPYASVEVMPSFPGGETELMKYISTNMRYPVAIPMEDGLITRSVVRFVVTRTGEVKDIEPMKGYEGTYLSDSLIKIIERMPNWIPGRQNGKSVDVYYTLPINIHIQWK